MGPIGHSSWDFVPAVSAMETFRRRARLAAWFVLRSPLGAWVHNPYELVRHAQENFGAVLMFAFGQPAAGVVINEQFKGEWKFLNKLVYEVSERRADRALLEMAVQLRALDELNDWSKSYQQRKMPSLGTVIQGDGSKTDLYFRDMTNKIIHAGGSGGNWRTSKTRPWYAAPTM